MNLLLRPATRDDLPALLAIEEQSFSRPRWRPADFLKDRCTVAECDGQIAGFIVVREVFSGNTHTRAEREILNVATHPDFRRAGIATRLLENELASGAIYFLEVRESNVPAQTLYRKLGFTELHRRPKYYSHPVETAIVMQMK
ncbi:MAG TPA: GNAT family N-acetyltransferase [Bryobacteraceae bacterium]|nr:GNAT family N-acetyltransferase [Bryobacteraceae bacterium]